MFLMIHIKINFKHNLKKFKLKRSEKKENFELIHDFGAHQSPSSGSRSHSDEALPTYTLSLSRKSKLDV
jgi:hypothetical protein